MLEWAKPYPDVAFSLPSEPREVEKLHRDFVSTVVFTICGMPFADWVTERINDRNAFVEQKKDMNVHLDPEIAAILNQSTSVSTMRGVSNNLLKVSDEFQRCQDIFNQI